MPVYQYLMLAAVNSTNWAEIQHLPAAERPEQTFTSTLYIMRPGSTEAEERPAVEFFPLLNELGQDGWRLIESGIPDSRVATAGGNYYGWTTEIGLPVRTRWMFIREMPSA